MKRLKLKMITRIQKILLKVNKGWAGNLYYFLAKMHFKTYFNLDLQTETENSTEKSKMAAKRHSTLVLKVLYKNSKYKALLKVRNAARKTFVKNILLNAKL